MSCAGARNDTNKKLVKRKTVLNKRLGSFILASFVKIRLSGSNHLSKSKTLAAQAPKRFVAAGAALASHAKAQNCFLRPGRACAPPQRKSDSRQLGFAAALSCGDLSASV